MVNARVDAAEYLRRRAGRNRAEWMRGYARALEARAEDTSSVRLAELARDDIRAMRVWAARNQRCLASALELLARDDDSYVTWNVLCNPELPESGLRHLAEQEASVDRVRLGPFYRHGLSFGLASSATQTHAGVFAGSCGRPESSDSGSVRTSARERFTSHLPDVTVHVDEEARHEIFNETNRNEVVADLVRWPACVMPARQDEAED